MIRFALIAGLFAGNACAPSGGGAPHDAEAKASLEKKSPTIVVVGGIGANAPCEQCHKYVEDAERGRVKAHPEIRVKHMPDAQCETCHDPNQPGRLKLASGKAVELENTHILCGQCHATEAADWSVGIHGKQMGNWQSEIHRFACTRCHDAHNPAFGSMQAVDPPPFPKFGIPKGGH